MGYRKSNNKTKNEKIVYDEEKKSPSSRKNKETNHQLRPKVRNRLKNYFPDIKFKYLSFKKQHSKIYY